MISILSLATVIGVIVLFVWVKFQQAKGTIEHLLKTNSELESQNRSQHLEIARQKVEIKNAKIKRKNDENVKHINAFNLDQQLHQHDYFRDDDNHGVRSIQSDLSKSCGHAGDETSSACSQSDL